LYPAFQLETFFWLFAIGVLLVILYWARQLKALYQMFHETLILVHCCLTKSTA